MYVVPSFNTQVSSGTKYRSGAGAGCKIVVQRPVSAILCVVLFLAVVKCLKSCETTDLGFTMKVHIQPSGISHICDIWYI
jgi:hypothetical protein